MDGSVRVSPGHCNWRERMEWKELYCSVGMEL